MASNKKGHFLITVLFFLLISPFCAQAQQNKYLIYFSDKNSSPFSSGDPSQFLSPKAIERRVKQNISVTLQDLPVNPDYVDSLTAKGAQVLFTSKWFNAALVLADPAQISSINTLSFVVNANKVNRKTKIYSGSVSDINLFQSALSLDYGSSSNQVSMLGVDQMHEAGFHGKGVLIAVIDGGFKDANLLSVFDSLFLNNRVIATYDFVDQETNVYDDHPHGTQVLSLLAAYSPGALIGGAWKSDYLLLRTEEDGPESISEEVNWVRAAEYADSAGADMINSSLGYNTFDDPTMDYSYSDMDGNTTLISKAADIAASKGILVVNSAGNEGSSSWKYILSPADGDSVLTVGAVTSGGYYYFMSSQGPTYDRRIKPDVAAQGNNVVVASLSGGTQTGSGTSFSSPLIAGLAAGLWQAFPNLTNMDLHYFIRRSASQYLNPDYKLGYGIPHFTVAREMVLSHSERVTVFPNPIDNQPLILNLPKHEINKEISLRFTDITGRVMAEEVILSGEFRNELKTNLSNWTYGVYLLTIITSNHKYIEKILIK